MKIASTTGAAAPAKPTPPKPAGKGGPSFVEVLRAGDREIRAGAAPPAAKPPVPAAAKPEAPSPVAKNLARALDDVNKGEARIDALLEAAAKGKTFTPGELIAMQATVFRYSQTVEVLTRATDKLVGAVKQTLGTQV